MAGGSFGGGNGTMENPYLIEDALDLRAIENNMTAHYKLAKDIDLNNAPWKPIYTIELVPYDSPWGTQYNKVIKPFSGVFDFNKFTIKNLKIDIREDVGDSRRYYGLFSKTDNARFTNVSIINASVEPTYSSRSYIGTLAGEIKNTTVDKVDLQAAFIFISEGSDSDVGGLAGNIEEGCTLNDVKIDFKCDMSGDYTGALAGEILGEIDNPVIINRCDVKYNGKTIYSCQGAFSSVIEHAVLNECSAIGEMFSTNYTYGFGAFSGYTFNAELNNCYAIMNVRIGDPTFDDPLPEMEIGLFIGASYESVINNCYVVVDGELPEGYDQFIGDDRGGTSVNNSYYDSTLVGSTSSVFANGKTTEQMKTKGTYAGWDFENVWRINPGMYPEFMRGSKSTGQLEAMPLTSIKVVN